MNALDKTPQHAKDMHATFWGTAAQEIDHITARYDRLKTVTDEYNSMEQPCSGTLGEALRAQAKYEKEIGYKALIEQLYESSHVHREKHGTPGSDWDGTWDGSYPTVRKPWL